MDITVKLVLGLITYAMLVAYYKNLYPNRKD